MSWVAPVVIIACGVFYRLAWQPRQEVNKAVQHQVATIEKLNFSLQKSAEALHNLPAPDTVTSSANSAKGYAETISKSRDSFGLINIERPKQVPVSKYSDRTKNFNSLVEDPGYTSAINGAANAVLNNKEFLAHHSGVMQALANLLAYNAPDDLSSADTTTLKDRIDAAQTGLEKTLQRISAAPGYTDPTMDQILGYVREVQSSADITASSVGSAAFAANKQSFTEVVNRAQKDIIANRNKFWKSESEELIKIAEEAQKPLLSYLHKLQSL